MGAPAKRIDLTQEEGVTLRMWASSGMTEQRLALRARVMPADSRSRIRTNC